jgi:hypothetical protein
LKVTKIKSEFLEKNVSLYNKPHGDGYGEGHGDDHGHTGIARRDLEQPLQHARQGAEKDRQDKQYRC